MNSERIYNEIINNSKSRGLNKKLLDGYFERHHIIPKCLNGINDKSNLVLLTAREHYLCHWLLWKTNKENRSLFFAFYAMMFKRQSQSRLKISFTSKQYEILRNENSKQRKKHIISKEGIQRIKDSKKGSNNFFFNKTHSDLLKAKWSAERKLGGNPTARSIIFQGLYFSSLQECALCFNKSRKWIAHRLINERFNDSFFIDKGSYQ
jgi:hypothetical protein